MKLEYHHCRPRPAPVAVPELGRWPVGRFPCPGILSARTVGPRAAVPWDSLALASLGCGSGLRVYMARSSPSPTESSSRGGSFPEPLCYGLAVRFQLLSTDGLHRRSYFPLQVLGLRPDEDLHLAALMPSQSHQAAPNGAGPWLPAAKMSESL